MIEVLEYNLETLRKDGEFILYRGRHRRQTDPTPPAILVQTPAMEHPAPGCLKRMEHEFSLKAELDSAWAVRPLALTQEQGRSFLLLEDPGADPLDLLLEEPMELGQVLTFATGLSAALVHLHACGLVHKEIKPANVLVNPSTDQVWLTGFGIASRLPRERQSPEPPEFIAGTLPYMAPEQTGRMNRSIDSRSDLYALGVTLYEMLTGSLPFTATDPMEWVHCHIARQPAPPGERLKGIPSPVSEIVMKLLAKTAEERYQTAAGLEKDLRRCLAQWQGDRRIDAFPLGQQDRPDRLLIPEKLYGREREIEKLLASFDRVIKAGTPELVLVAGYSGIGKSSVVNELHRVLVPPRGLFASGKFDQYKRDIPYSTLAQAFQSLTRRLLAKSEAGLATWRAALLETLGPNGRLMIDLVPELKLIIGDQPPVPDLPPQDARRRFQLVFRRFIGVFARPEHPLALFLDDLQWLDAATLDLLEDLLAPAGVQHLMLIGAYRDNEVTAAHPLMRKLEAIRSAGANVQEITLAPLAAEDVRQLIADALRCEPERAAPLAQLVHEKTGGNPFFLVQFLHTLAEEGWLAFDYQKAEWSWDLNRIHAKRHRDNVVDLMVGRLNRLPLNTQKALQQLACLGNIASARMLSIILGKSPEEVGADLWDAVRLELLEHLEGSYKFVHDRVQEAAYSLIPEDLRNETHLRIGRQLAAHTPSASREEAIFDIVNQYNRGVALITSRDECEQMAELNLLAGKRAKTSTAYASALNYLVAGAALLPADSWESRHNLIFALELHRAECEFLTGALRPAEERLTLLSERAANTVERATLACLRINVYTTLDQSERAVEVCLEYLAHLGLDWPPHPGHQQALDEYRRIWSRLGARRVEDLIALPLISDPAILGTLDVLNDVVAPALFTDRNLLSLVICRMVNLSLEHGNSDASCFAFVFLGMIAGPHFDNYEAAFQFGRLGYELTEKHGLHRYQARTYMAFGNFVMPWARHVRAGRDLVRRAFDIANKAGDLTFAAYSCNNLNTNLLAPGDALAGTQLEAERGLEFARKAGFGLVVEIITAQLQLIRTLRGLTPAFGSFDCEQFDEPRFEDHLASQRNLALAECWYWIRKLQARVLAGDYSSAIEASLKALPLLWTSPSFFETAEYEFYGGLARAAFYNRAPVEEQPRHQEALAAHYRQLEIWAKNCPENFENRAALVGAEIARIEGRPLEAEQLYEQAIRSARANGFVHNEAIANELAARFYLARGFEKIAHAYLQDARYGYLRWGAEGKVRQLDQLYPHLTKEESVRGPAITIETPVERLDLATVIKVSQTVASETVLEKLVDTLMRTAIEHAGAARGLLILPRGDELRIEAEATTSGDTVAVFLRKATLAAAELPASVLHYVVRTRESVILDNASAQNSFSEDPYMRQHHARSILCLPLLKQAKLIGVLYLENNLALRVFTPARIAVLKLLASGAAISLENTRLYSELTEREARIRRLVEANIIGIVIWNLEGRIIEANEAFLRIVGYGGEDFVSGRVSWREITPDKWRDADAQALAEVAATGACKPFEKEYFRKDGSRVPVLVGAALLEEGRDEGVAFVLDLTERKRAEESLREGESYLAEAQKLSHTGSWAWSPNQDIRYWSEECYRVLSFDQQDGLPRFEEFFQRIHPDDQPGFRDLIETAIREKAEWEADYRIVHPGGAVRDIHVVGHPVLSPSGDLLEFVGTVIDITERKRAEEELRRSKAYLSEAQRLSHTGSFGWDVLSGEIYWSDETFRIFELEPKIKITTDLILQRTHPDDRQAVQQFIEHASSETTKLALEHRLLMSDGSIKYLRVVGRPSADEMRPSEFVGAVTDITDHKRAEESLRESESYLAEAQKLSHTGSWAWRPDTDVRYWSEECYRVLGFDPRDGPPLTEELIQRIHPDDRPAFRESAKRGTHTTLDEEVDYRIVHPGGAVRDIHSIGHPVFSPSGDLIKYTGTVIDVTERKRAEEELRASERKYRDLVDTTPAFIHTALPDGSLDFLSRGWLEYGGLALTDLKDWRWTSAIHPEDVEGFVEKWRAALASGEPFEAEARVRRADGEYRWFLQRNVPLRDETGKVVKWYGTGIDIEERKTAEEKIREQEIELRQILDLAPQHIAVSGPDGSPLYANHAALEYFGIAADQWRDCSRTDFVHPDDRERFLGERENQFVQGAPYEVEARLLRHDGEFRWFLLRGNPVKDERGQITRWYSTATDIEDRKQAEEGMRNENIALREEIITKSMFEEIVGNSTALQTVLSRISKVAPSDSTVLITGETGTGKELVARAIHRRSGRSPRPFVSVNCAAIPRDLIASELFGHEKGAFTGATQQRLGRFELANGGTIFLDEAGELPPETQIALLRVLQEREFERVGGTRRIRADVRVIAATNRDLAAAIRAGSFRSDLFYRLSVFPIEIPPLRDRREDIPLLVEYFIDRYARKAGKTIRSVSKKTLELFQSYPWPGNIRELQNVIERSVILCETETFSIDESWLPQQPFLTEPKSQTELSQSLLAQEKDMIEAALRECQGRVFGPSGAADKLGIPRSTLESKIRKLKINKNRFKTQWGT